jgi:hypothetical protein
MMVGAAEIDHAIRARNEGLAAEAKRPLISRGIGEGRKSAAAKKIA